MRVITGTASGAKLISPTGKDIVRPTSERIKEAIFSSIQMDVAGSRVLDLFAGSGQLGIEALSRGADFCVFVDNDLNNQKIIKENLQKTKLFKNTKVLYSDAIIYISHCKDSFDFIFLDPPYSSDLLQNILKDVKNVMADDCKVICETNKMYDFEECGLDLYREYRYGRTKITVFKKGDVQNEE